MPLGGGGASRPKREFYVDQKDLDGATFLIEYIGKPFDDKKFGYKKIPVEVTLPAGIRVLESKEDGGETQSYAGTEAVWFARGTAVVNQLTDEETEAPITVSLDKQQGEDLTKNPYYVLTEVVTEGAE